MSPGTPRSLADLLPPTGDEVRIHGPDGEWTGTRLHDRVSELARELSGAQPIEPSTAIGVSLPNGGELIAAMFAVWSAGGVLVPINPRLTPTEVRRIEEEVVGRRYDDGVAIVSFTSGTTGEPRPVPLLHERVLEGLDQVLTTLRGKEARRSSTTTSATTSAPASASASAPMPNLVPVSLSLWAGIYQVLFAFRLGAPVIVMDGFETAAFADLVRRFAIRSTVLPPAAMVMLADDRRIEDLAPLRYVRSISSPLSPLQARRFRDRFGISVLNGYGQTELGGEVVGWSAADSRTYGDDKLGAVGRPHPGVEVCTDGATGELLVRIPGRFDEWQHTGDVARIDADGFVWIEGRLSDMVNRGGLKVHPAEVEEVLRLSPAVADAAVAGVADERLGEVPVAFVVESEPIGDAELEALCREHLAPYKVPARFERVDALPRNEAGKVLKRALQGGSQSELRTGAGRPGAE